MKTLVGIRVNISSFTKIELNAGDDIPSEIENDIPNIFKTSNGGTVVGTIKATNDIEIAFSAIGAVLLKKGDVIPDEILDKVPDAFKTSGVIPPAPSVETNAENIAKNKIAIDTNKTDIADLKFISKFNRKMEVIAHRGFRGHYPQNTMLAFTCAYYNGADSIETDVQVSSDGKLVLFHDTTLEALTNGTGYIKSHTLDALQLLKFNSTVGTDFSDAMIPKFKDLLSFAKSKGCYIYPEIKAYRTQSDIDLMIQEVIDARMEELTMFQSFKLSDLEYVRTINKKIGIGYLGSGTATLEAKIDNLSVLGNSSLLWEKGSLLSYPQIVEYAYNNNVDIATWTVSNDEDAKQLMSIGVNKIMSDIRLGGSKW